MVIIITLTTSGTDDDEADGIVSELLDSGVLQDAFNEYAEDHGLDVVVTDAVTGRD